MKEVIKKCFKIETATLQKSVQNKLSKSNGLLSDLSIELKYVYRCLMYHTYFSN